MFLRRRNGEARTIRGRIAVYFETEEVGNTDRMENGK